MSLWSEFKNFAVKGNVIDLAVGVIIGSAFGKIVSSFVGDVFMPPLGILLNNINFKNLRIVLSRGADGAPISTLNYGVFIQNIVEFLIIAMVVFIFVKFINRFKAKEEKKETAPVLSKQEQLLVEIRDVLKSNVK